MRIADKGFVAASCLPEKNLIDIYMDICRERDHITYRHSQNVELVAEKLSSVMGLCEDLKKVICLGARYHDIGKTVLPENLIKSGMMYSDIEKAEVQKHPEKGFEILNKFGAFMQIPKEAMDIVRMHHERLNGSGYPNGISADRIPLYVRIVTIADILAALCEDRYYRPAWDLDKALQFLKNKKGVFYDADVVESSFLLGDFLCTLSGDHDAG